MAGVAVPRKSLRSKGSLNVCPAGTDHPRIPGALNDALDSQPGRPLNGGKMKNSEMIAGLLKQDGAEVTVTQEDDGNGYTVMNVAVPGWGDIGVTVNE